MGPIASRNRRGRWPGGAPSVPRWVGIVKGCASAGGQSGQIGAAPFLNINRAEGLYWHLSAWVLRGDLATRPPYRRGEVARYPLSLTPE